MNRTLGLCLLALGILIVTVAGIWFAIALADQRGPAAGSLIVAGVIALVGVGFLVGAWALMRHSKPLGSVPAFVDGEYHQYISDIPQAGELLGRPYTTFFQPPISGKNGRPALLRVSVPALSAEVFAVTSQTWFDRLGQRVGLASKIESDDEEFDNACYIRTEAPEFAEEFVSDARKRQAILDLRGLGFTEIALREGEFQANWTGFDPSKNDAPELTAESAAHLLVLAEDLPEDDQSGISLAPRTATTAIVLWVLMLSLAPLFFFAFWYKPVYTSELILTALPIVGTAYLFFGWIAGLLLRGTSTSHDRWVKLVGVGLLVFSLGGVGAVAAANAMLDTTAPTVHRVTVVNKRTTRSRNSTTYYVECRSWRPGDGNIEFTISANEYTHVVPGRAEMVVTAAPGWLGVEWIVTRHLFLQPQRK